MLIAMESKSRRGSTRAGVVATLALIVALVALFLAIFRDPLGPVYQMSWNAFGNGLGNYDFSSPEKALKSNWKMQQSRDLRAVMEYSRKVEGPELQERIDTLDVKEEKEVKLPIRKSGPRPIAKLPGPEKDKAEDKKEEKTRTVKLLFISYKERGEVKHKIEGFEKHEPSGFWKNSYVSRYEVEEINKELAKKMREWEEKGS